MTSEEREKMIATYKDGYEEVLQSLKDLPEQSLTAHPIANGALPKSFTTSPIAKQPAPSGFADC